MHACMHNALSLLPLYMVLCIKHYLLAAEAPNGCSFTEPKGRVEAAGEQVGVSSTKADAIN
jgi:hypothetical protein